MQITTYREARTYLESFIHPSIYKRIAKKEHVIDPLERMRAFLALLDNPQNEYKSIIVTGTSGKGSTAYFLSKILEVSGYKTGLTVSPHLQKINERMQVNGTVISDGEFIALLNSLIPTINEMTRTIGEPTYYEILLSMAFTYFANQEVDIVVAEVGLEGKYDGTNVLFPILTILTNISLDHTELLGDTVEKIAAEAVSAIKPSCVAVMTGRLQDSVREIVRHRMAEVGVMTLYENERDFHITNVSGDEHKTAFTCTMHDVKQHIRLSIPGLYQAENAGIAFAASLTLRDAKFHISSETTISALAQSEQIPGRYEERTYLGKKLILDGAHNPAKMKAFIDSLQMLEPKRRKIFVMAFKKDKDVADMMQYVKPVADQIVMTSFQGTTDMTKNAAASIEKLKTYMADVKSKKGSVLFEEDAKKALEIAVQSVKDTDSIVVVTGSLYLVGEVRDILASATYSQE